MEEVKNSSVDSESHVQIEMPLGELEMAGELRECIGRVGRLEVEEMEWNVLLIFVDFFKINFNK